MSAKNKNFSLFLVKNRNFFSTAARRHVNNRCSSFKTVTLLYYCAHRDG